jgi:hypothetical protein
MKTHIQEVTKNMAPQKESEPTPSQKIAIDNMVALMERECKDMSMDQIAAWIQGYTSRAKQEVPYVRDDMISESLSDIMNYNNHIKRRRPNRRTQIS